MRQPMPGDRFVRFMKAAALAIGGSVGCLVLAAMPVLFIILDVVLMPLFVYAYISSQGIALEGGVAWLAAWGLSLATTGLLLGIFDRLEQPVVTRASKVLIAVGILVAVQDSLADVGGVTAWHYPDTEAANIIPPGLGDFIWRIQAPAVFAFLLVHEPLMRLGYRWALKSLADADEFGEKLLRAGVKAGSVVLNVAKGILFPVGVLCAIALDFVLIPQLATGPGEDWTMWAMSGATSGFVLLCWLVGDVRRLSTRDRWIIGIAWILALGDTVLDVAGFMTAIYGDGQRVLVPAHVTAVGILLALNVGALTFVGERMFRELFRTPKDHSEPASELPTDSADESAGAPEPSAPVDTDLRVLDLYGGRPFGPRRAERPRSSKSPAARREELGRTVLVVGLMIVIATALGAAASMLLA